MENMASVNQYVLHQLVQYKIRLVLLIVWNIIYFKK